LYFSIRRVAPTVPALAPTKVLRSDAFVPTRQRSSRASWAAESVAARSEPSLGTAEATGSQQEATVAAAATAASAARPEPVPTTVDQAGVVEIPDDDATPPGWVQWEN
jgi:hypothetical protein